MIKYKFCIGINSKNTDKNQILHFSKNNIRTTANN